MRVALFYSAHILAAYGRPVSAKADAGLLFRWYKRLDRAGGEAIVARSEQRAVESRAEARRARDHVHLRTRRVGKRPGILYGDRGRRCVDSAQRSVDSCGRQALQHEAAPTREIILIRVRIWDRREQAILGLDHAVGDSLRCVGIARDRRATQQRDHLIAICEPSLRRDLAR